MAVSTVVFDLDGTICEYRRDQDDLLEIAFGRLGMEPAFDGETYRHRYEALLEAADGMADLRERCFSSILEECGHDPSLGVELARYYAEERTAADVVFRAGAESAIRTIQGRYRVGLVTNGSPEYQRDKLTALGIEDVFETVVYAGYDTPAKPASEPFELALEDLDATADETVYVGNSFDRDVRGATAAGLDAIWTPHRKSDVPGSSRNREFDPGLPDSAGTDLPDSVLELDGTARAVRLDRLDGLPALLDE